MTFSAVGAVCGFMLMIVLLQPSNRTAFGALMMNTTFFYLMSNAVGAPVLFTGKFYNEIMMKPLNIECRSWNVFGSILT